MDSHAVTLKEHRKNLDLLMQRIPAVAGYPCKYFLFLTRLHGITLPFAELYDRLIEKRTRQPDVFDLFRADLRTHIYVDVAIRDGNAFVRPLRQVVQSFDWVHLSLREFIFVFGDAADHKALFNDWSVRTTPETFIEASRVMVSDIMRSLVVYAIEQQEKRGACPSRDEAQAFVIALLRKEVFKAYAQDTRSWDEIKDHLASVDELLCSYNADYKAFCRKIAASERKGTPDHSVAVKETLHYYQLRGRTDREAGETPVFYNCGIELEFQTPEAFVDIDRFADSLRKEAGLTALARESSDEAYADPNGGVLSSDDSLPTLDGYFPTEYASAVIKNKEEAERVARVIRYINKSGCLVDESAGIHMHISREKCPLDGLKRLVLRFARLEKMIRQCFFNEGRYHDWNMYGPSLLSLYGDVKTPENRSKNFLLMVYFVRRAKNIDELFDASSCSGRYASLFLKTKLGTMEFRGHPATMSVKRIMNYFEFTQALVASAMANKKDFVPFHRLRMAVKLKEKDKTKCLPDPLYAVCSYNKFDASDIPSQEVRSIIRERFLRITQKIAATKDGGSPLHNYHGQMSHKRKSFFTEN